MRDLALCAGGGSSLVLSTTSEPWDPSILPGDREFIYLVRQWPGVVAPSDPAAFAGFLW